MSKTESAVPTLNWDGQIDMQLLLASAPIAIAVVAQTGAILYTNSKFDELFGYRAAELVGQPIELLIPERFRASHVMHRIGYTQTPRVRPMGSALDLAGLRKDGCEFPLEAGLSYLQLAGQLVIMTTITDISRRKQTEEALGSRVEERTRELERRRQVADSLRDILAILNSNHSAPEILAYIVEQAQWLFHADAALIYGRDERSSRLTIQASSNLAEEAQFGVETMLETALANPVMQLGQPVIEHTATVATTSSAGTKSPTERANCSYATHLTVPLRIKGELYGGLQICYREARDFTKEELQLAMSMGDQTALAIENARLHTQIAHTAVATERNRIARDLHDAVTQTLFSASMIAEVLPKLWPRNAAEGQRRLEELRGLTRGALAEMRTLLLELRPTKLMEVELADLLRQLAEAIAGRARLPITVQIDGDAPLPPEVKVAFYRIAQEALNNVAKHAQAYHATIHVHRQPDQIEMMITDDGIGFVFAAITAAHLGLGIMRERAEDIGATLQVESSPGQGTTVCVRWFDRLH
jgi:PAS domain S-box-containing protein